MAASIDPVDKAKETVEKYKLTFDLACQLNVKKLSEKTGAFYDEKNGFAQGAGFIIDPEGKVADAVYSTGPIGRYTASECLGMIDFFVKRASKNK